MFAVVGLGNPGKEYERTRHNAGFWTIAALAQSGDMPGARWQEKFGCRFLKTTLAEEDCVLVLPQLFMNRSGEALRPLVDFFKIPPEQVIVVFDEIDLPSGALRIRQGGGTGGHNGMASLVEHLPSPNFFRIRVGIGRPEHGDAGDWVLGTVKGEELKRLVETTAIAAEAVQVLIREGLAKAQQRYTRGGV